MICDKNPQLRIADLGKEPEKAIADLGRRIQLTTTPCHFGGDRYWFVCPKCRGRCGVLYPYFCRKCSNGRYKSELMSPQDRKVHKAIKIRASLGQKSGGILVPFPTKPKWMRRRTYERLKQEATTLEKSILAETEVWLQARRPPTKLPDRF